MVWFILAHIFRILVACSGKFSYPDDPSSQYTWINSIPIDPSLLLCQVLVTCYNPSCWLCLVKTEPASLPRKICGLWPVLVLSPNKAGSEGAFSSDALATTASGKQPNN